jgi:hypothetical protein
MPCQLLDAGDVDGIQGPLAPPGQVAFGGDGEWNGRTDPVEDGIADLLLFLSAELVGCVAVFRQCV